MRKGFVFGKFYPFHLGHAALIEWGLQQCDALSVLVCASDREEISLELRCRWISTHFAEHPRLKVVPVAYREAELPNTSVSSREVSQLWAKHFAELLPQAELLFTSEPYGAFVAEAMGIAHRSFDEGRRQVPVSASQIRQQPLRHWAYLPEVVRPHFVRKVVLNGTESTGKSVLTQRLAAHYHTNFVAEAGRELVAQSLHCTGEQLQQIALQHAWAIEEALPKANKLLFIDTDVHITRSYSRFLFGEALAVSGHIWQLNRAHLMFLLDKDAPFVQDGTRLSEAQRNQLHQGHLEELRTAGAAFHLIRGSWEERFQHMVALIDRELL